MFFLVPAIIWGGITYGGSDAGWCDGDWGYGMELAMGVVFALVYLLLELLFFCIFDFIQFCVDRSGQVSRGNCCTTFCDRVSIMMYEMFIDVPLLVLFALGM